MIRLDKGDLLSFMLSQQMTKFVVSYGKLLDPDLTAQQYLILQILSKTEQRNSSELAQELDVTLPAVTNLTNKLVRKGYLERRTSDTDRRSVNLSLTEQGREVEKRLLTKYKELTRHLWSQFTERELDLLVASYQKMLDALQKNPG
ncbi:DNA-binding MarR family transcriptional regulator [Fontibacillus phaseoli]|uniref:DNA-binding MarR family transcriptional regulator n=2 Tax=Fontibacillus phaseoli TaxID=1416533 RepID=A0A369B899_9BACL|nr:DNA-binding MarR family transcriptional regulator [Fontibacillus phaseoli]